MEVLPKNESDSSFLKVALSRRMINLCPESRVPPSLLCIQTGIDRHGLFRPGCPPKPHHISHIPYSTTILKPRISLILPYNILNPPLTGVFSSHPIGATHHRRKPQIKHLSRAPLGPFFRPAHLKLRRLPAPHSLFISIITKQTCSPPPLSSPPPSSETRLPTPSHPSTHPAPPGRSTEPLDTMDMDNMLGGGGGGGGAMGQFPLEQWFFEMPVCTRWWTVATVVTSLLVQCHIITPFQLFYSFRAVFVKNQVCTLRFLRGSEIFPSSGFELRRVYEGSELVLLHWGDVYPTKNHHKANIQIFPLI